MNNIVAYTLLKYESNQISLLTFGRTFLICMEQQAKENELKTPNKVPTNENEPVIYIQIYINILI